MRTFRLAVCAGFVSKPNAYQVDVISSILKLYQDIVSQGKMTSVDFVSRIVTLENAAPIPFHICSVDVGSSSFGMKRLYH
jgi:NADH dehydrogenase FAD-containing subunit